MSKIIFVFRHPFLEFNRLLKWLFREGSWSLLRHEQLIIEAAIDSLAFEHSAQIRKQLAMWFFVDRIGGDGRINDIWFDDIDPEHRLSDPSFEERTIRVFVKVDGKMHRTLVKFYNGFISSVQLPRALKFSNETKLLEIVRVEAARDNENYEKAIDRMEHGSGLN